MRAGLGIEWRGDEIARLQRKMRRDSYGLECVRNEEMGSQGEGGFKKKWVATLGFRTVCKIALGVRNYFAYHFGFRTVCEICLGVRNFSHSLRKFRKVCELIS